MKTEIKIQHPDKLYIDGKWVDAKKGKRIDVISPYNEEIFMTVAEATEEDVDSAVKAARAAFDQGPWTRMSVQERADYLRKLSAALESRLPELSAAWVEQIGALNTLAPFVIGGAKHSLDAVIAMADTYPWVEERPLADGPGKGLVVREAVGVVAAIVPWNNPFGIMLAKVGPALLAGCTVIMKPAPETPIDAYIIAEAADAIGLPEGVINLVTADREASDYLVRHQGVDKVSFTGSVAAGARIGSVCGERFARCTLELGGKSAAIVLEDYDIETAAQTLVQTITMSTGQVCCTLSRAIVPASKHDKFISAVESVMSSIKVGDPYDTETQMGPVAMGRQRDRIEDYIGIAKAEGATLVTGGGRPVHLDRGFYIQPTLFTGVDRSMRIAQEEVFGPVLSVLTYKDEAEAIAIANDSAFGLYGAVFTNDSDAAYRVARGVRAGTMSQNAFRFDGAMPFGGFKSSGVGREGGKEGLSAYTELKSIILS